ncbi:hypothetical protein [Mucilaginibacter paludis]|uniref:DUF3945 domain-containing protein n=1 Tax=Mucilaginibacter paludis DSM 18603 TaxID=714943 RepID=H1YHF8_9SPHI|nr:hypothetical protein [Mucilaginibacter paludis]EHQ25492.1 hypothetical protein Mucpa_1330 [Mucilaginibacter paludis DSM 18603]
MAQLNDPAKAGELREHLEQQENKGYEWVVYDTDNPINTRYDLTCFLDEHEAVDHAREYQQIFNWHEAVPISSLIYDFKVVERTLLQTEKGTYPNLSLKTNKAMNLNNLDNLKEELKELGFPKKLAEEMEKNMQKNVPEFQLRHNMPADKGQVDLQLHFKQSGQSDYYYFNKYSVTLNNAKPLEEEQKYLVISPGEQNKPVFRKFDSPHEAISYFKEQKGDSELAVGKDVGHKTTLATMEKDKVNFVAKDFQKTFYSPAVTQNVYVEKGKGFSAEQSANLIQGRSVYRDDLLNLGGQQYKAWIKLDFDQAKDRFDNFKTKQFHDPSYGFDLKAVLDRYNIKELADPKQREKLEESLKNGNRPLITTVKDGQEVKLRIEAVPRYGQVNMFQENGKPEKREQFQVTVKNDLLLEKGKNTQKDLSQSRGVKV